MLDACCPNLQRNGAGISSTPPAPPPQQGRGQREVDKRRRRKLTMMEDPLTQKSTSLGERLKVLRSARSIALGRKLSQKEVANAIGVARSYVAGCESDSD